MQFVEPYPHFDRPDLWCLAFRPHSRYPRLDRLVPGRFKHVNCFGLSKRSGVWVFVDVEFQRTTISTAWDNAEVLPLLRRWTAGATVVLLAAGFGQHWVWRLGLWCVPATAHIVGLKTGAVIPDQLYRHCLKIGGEVLIDAIPPGTGAEQGSHSPARDRAGVEPEVAAGHRKPADRSDHPPVRLGQCAGRLENEGADLRLKGAR